MSSSIVLYTRQNCHLCDEAFEQLRGFGLEPQVIDIDADPALCRRFTECVPVVEIDGRVRFRGHINRVLLRRILDARS